MKLCLFLCAATVLAVKPPRIELELSSLARPARLATSAFRGAASFQPTAEKDTSYAASSTSGTPNAPAGDQTVYNRHDWSQHCVVLASSSTDANPNCPLPVARAWDHLDRNVTDQITTKIYRVDNDNVACVPGPANSCEVSMNAIDYGVRSTFVFKYDVTDDSFNKAEQVVFVLVIDDQCGEACWPTINICGDSSESWEAASSTTLCTGTTADDPVPSENLDSNLEYSIHAITVDAQGTQTTSPTALCDKVAYSDMTCANTALTTTICKGSGACTPDSFLVTFHVCDNAGKYGPVDNTGATRDNCVTANKVITISDTTKPIITVTGWGAPPGTALLWECNSDANVDRSDCGIKGDVAVSGRTVESDDCGWHGHLPHSDYHCRPKSAGWSDPTDRGDHCKSLTTESACIAADAIDGTDGTNADGTTDCEWAEVVTHDSGDFHDAYSAQYHDSGATVYDTLDTDRLDFPISYTATQSPSVDTTQLGDYTITYQAADRAGNDADQKVRHVTVVDTLAPTVILDDFEFVKDIHDADVVNSTNVHQNTTLHLAMEEAPLFVEPEWHCADSCDTTGDAMKLEPVWDKPWNDRVVGDYYRTYTCNDTSGNSHSAVRRFTVKDEVKPTIRVMGKQTQTIEATVESEYTDQGATCHDYVDGVLSHAVEVSGQVVNMRVPGNYTIQYDCQDLSGNEAIPMHRVVTIIDSTPPTITMLGESPIYIEAGFEYEDAGATASDTLDGVLTDFITKDGDTVNVANAFKSARSCREILTAAKGRDADATANSAEWAPYNTSHPSANTPALDSGMYFITVWVAAESTYKRLLVHCDMTTAAPEGGDPVGYTYHHFESQTGTTVVPYGGDDGIVGSTENGECASIGLKMVSFKDKSASCAWIKQRYSEDFPGLNGADFDCSSPSTTEASDRYLCGTNDELVGDRNIAWSKHKNNNELDHLIGGSKTDVSRAEAGVFVIYYHVQDEAGNTEVMPSPARTVIVKDTLPPVISLHLKNKFLQASHTTQVSGQDKQGSLYNTFPYNQARAVANPATEATAVTMDAGSNKYLADSYQPATGDVVSNSFPSGPTTGYANYMAEHATSSVNAWVIGAVASAVAGVALLTFSRRQQQRVTVDV